MNIFKKIFKNKTGQAITEYVLVLLIISAAAAAINTTYESTTDLIGSLAKNINETNVQGNGSGSGAATFVPPNAFTENTWGVTPLDASELRASSGNSIETNSGTIDAVGSSNLDYDNEEEREVKGKFLPVAYFMANQPSTWDTLTVYDYSYDLDEGSDTALKKFWKIEKTGNLKGADTQYVDNNLTCGFVDSCRKEGTAAAIWNTGNTETTLFTGYTTPGDNLTGVNYLQYANSKDKELFEQGFCFGTAAQCLPRHLSNGYYKISLIVIDKDHNMSDLVEQNITIKPEGYKVSYKYEYGDTEVISKTPVDDSDGEEKRELIDHQYGLVTDLYGVKHPVIEMNMIRKYSTKRYIIKTRQERVLCAVLIDTNTGQELQKQCFDSEWIYSEKEIADGGNAGFDTEGDDVSGNLWESERLVDNDWVFYVYDKRSLFNKRFVGDNGKAINLELKDEKGYLSSGGATYINSMSDFDDYNSLDGRSKTSEQSHDWQTGETGLRSNFSSWKDPKNDSYIDILDQMTTGYNSSIYPSHDVNNPGADIEGTNNTSYTGRDSFDDGPNTPSGNSPTTTVKQNAFANTSYIDFSEHTDHPAYIAPAYERSCIKNCNNEEFEAIDEAPEVSIMQLESTYALLDDKMKTSEKTKKLVEPFDEDIYRDAEDDFSDGSTMYQLRTNFSGRDDNGDTYITEHDNNYDPEFISIRLSLNDYYGYNPGANMDTVSNATSEMKEAFQDQMSSVTKGLEYPTNYNYGKYDNVGCNECTEPNFNVDGKMSQTEYRIVEGEVSPGGSYSKGSRCTATASYPDVSMSELMDARTRQYNWLEHAAFDWVYEYSGSGDGSAQKATSGARGNKTIKIRIAHWHTLGRGLNETTMGRYTDPYTTATKSNKPYAAVDMRGINSDINITTMNPDRFLVSMNPKSIYTSSDGQATNDDGDKDDGSGRRDMWRILSGSISTSEKDSDSCSTSWSCGCCTKTYSASAWAKTTITIKYNGLGEEEVSYKTSKGGSSRSGGKCCSCKED